MKKLISACRLSSMLNSASAQAAEIARKSKYAGTKDYIALANEQKANQNSVNKAWFGKRLFINIAFLFAMLFISSAAIAQFIIPPSDCRASETRYINNTYGYALCLDAKESATDVNLENPNYKYLKAATVIKGFSDLPFFVYPIRFVANEDSLAVYNKFEAEYFDKLGAANVLSKKIKSEEYSPASDIASHGYFFRLYEVILKSGNEAQIGFHYLKESNSKFDALCFNFMSANGAEGGVNILHNEALLLLSVILKPEENGSLKQNKDKGIKNTATVNNTSVSKDIIETFDQNGTYKWKQSENGKVSNGKYLFNPKKNGYGFSTEMCPSPFVYSSFDDWIFEVDMQIERSLKTTQFGISLGSKVSVVLSDLTNRAFISIGKNSSFTKDVKVKKGVNTLKLVRKGNQLEVYCNGKHLATGKLDEVALGFFYFTVSQSSNNKDFPVISYDNVKFKTFPKD